MLKLSGKLVKCFLCQKEVFRTSSRIERSKSKKYFCSKSCQTKWRNTLYVDIKHLNWKDGRHAYQSVLNRHQIPAQCSHCGTKDKRILATHHIDENHFNNNVKNLAWMCHNCHYLVHHDKVEKKAFLSKIA